MKNWKVENNVLNRQVVFDDLTSAIHFINRLAKLAEDAAHHPDINIRYNVVKLYLSTHDKGNTITEKDLKLAKQINQLLNEN